MPLGISLLGIFEDYCAVIWVDGAARKTVVQ